MIHLTWIIPLVVAFTLGTVGQQVDGEFRASLVAWARGFIVLAIGVGLGIICECISRDAQKRTR